VNPTPFLFAISDRARLSTPWEEWCAGLAELGVDALQVRERDLDDLDLLHLAEVARLAFPPPRRLLVNRRFDLALAAGADGVHLPADGLPIAQVRRALPQATIGRSTHSLAEIARAHAEGADYAVFGPIFETPSKPLGPSPHGLDDLAAAARIGLPVIAVGGIDAGNVADVLAHGATGVAAIRAFARRDSAAELVAAANGVGR